MTSLDWSANLLKGLPKIMKHLFFLFLFSLILSFLFPFFFFPLMVALLNTNKTYAFNCA